MLIIEMEQNNTLIADSMVSQKFYFFENHHHHLKSFTHSMKSLINNRQLNGTNMIFEKY